MNDYNSIGDKISAMTKEFVENVLNVIDPNDKDFPSHMHYVGSNVAFAILLGLSRMYELKLGIVLIEHMHCLKSMIEDHKESA